MSTPAMFDPNPFATPTTYSLPPAVGRKHGEASAWILDGLKPSRTQDGPSEHGYEQIPSSADQEDSAEALSDERLRRDLVRLCADTRELTEMFVKKAHETLNRHLYTVLGQQMDLLKPPSMSADGSG